MTEEHDNRISELYRQSSQETPPAHLDRAVMDRARKSVRRWGYSPFGNNWFARGAMVGVVVLCVMLILDVPQQPEPYAPVQDAVAPPSETLSETRNEAARPRALSSELPAEAEKKREAPAAPKAQYDFYELLPEMEVVVPEEEDQGPSLQLQKSTKEEPASTAATIPAGAFYLQAGSFQERGRADELKAKLLELGFKCDIQEVSVNNLDVYHHVRVGPFIDLEALNKSKQKLGELGIETQMVKERK
jgi:cell division protein FtsN